MRLFGRKKKKQSKVQQLAPPPRPKKVENDDDDDDGSSDFSCRFSTDKTYCSNPSRTEPEKSNTFKLSIPSMMKRSTARSPPPAAVAIDSPPRVERSNRWMSEDAEEIESSLSMYSLTRKQTIREPQGKVGSFVLTTPGPPTVTSGSISSLSTPGGVPISRHDDTATPSTTLDLPINNSYNFVWFPGTVALSVMEHRKEAKLSRTKSESWNHLSTPAPERMVRQSCIRHLQMRLSDSALDDDSHQNKLDQRVDVDAYMFLNKKDKETESAVLHDPHSKSGHLVKELVQSGNCDGAIAIARVLLQRQKKEAMGDCGGDISSITTLARQLSLLCLAAGRGRDAADYCAEAIHSLPTFADESSQGPAQSPETVDVLIEYGLILFGTNKAGQAIKTWREAIHMAIAVNGYQDKTVAVLLNCLGVAHLEIGDVKNSLRYLEESVELQRTLLRSSGSVASGSTHSSAYIVDDALFCLATTMGNLATACEREEQFDRAISLLEESIALFQSSSVETSDLEALVGKNLEHLEEARAKREEFLDDLEPTVCDDGDDDDDDDTDFYEYTSEAEEGGDGGRSQGVNGISSMCESICSEEATSSHVGSKASGSTSLKHSAADIILDDVGGDDDDDASVDSGRSDSLFGNPDGIPSRKLAVKMTMEQRDNHDFLLLGSLSAELTAEQRVRETVVTWFGRRIDGESANLNSSAPVITFDLEQVELDKNSRKSDGSEANSVELNDSAVDNADQNLNRIHKQAMKHLDANEIDEALKLLNRAMQSHRKKYGEVHHLVGTALHNIGMVNFFARRYPEALSHFEEAIRVRTKALGSDHPDVQASAMKIALIYLATDKLNKASESFRKIRETFLDVLGYGHPQLAKIHNNVGAVAFEFGDQEYALKCFEMAYEFQRRLLEEQDEWETPDDHEIVSLATANSLCNMGFVLAKSKEYLQAANAYENALEVLRNHLPRKHHRVLEVCENIDYLIRTFGLEMTQRSEDDVFKKVDVDDDNPQMNSMFCVGDLAACFR